MTITARMKPARSPGVSGPTIDARRLPIAGNPRYTTGVYRVNIMLEHLGDVPL
jgi:hypothetical protein